MKMKRWAFLLALGTGLLMMIAAFHMKASAEPRVIAIQAEKYQFTPAALTLKRGETVTLQLTSTDTIHGFLVKPLKIETGIVPGRVTELTITPEVTGTFRVNCDHFCGAGHSDMHMTVTVTE